MSEGGNETEKAQCFCSGRCVKCPHEPSKKGPLLLFMSHQDGSPGIAVRCDGNGDLILESSDRKIVISVTLSGGESKRTVAKIQVRSGVRIVGNSTDLVISDLPRDGGV